MSLKTSIFSLLVLFSFGSAWAACEPVGGDSCDPSVVTDGSCECTDDEGYTCDPEEYDDESCACVSSFMDEDEDDNTTNETTLPNQNYRFVLIEDLTQNVSGDSPGADIDAVSVTTPDGIEHFATSVEDFELGAGANAFADPNETLGAPDSGCTKKNFTALGGLDAGGYITLGFSESNTNVTFASGSQITVYELGPTTCPGQSTWDDDPYAVSISVSKDFNSFIEVGTGGSGLRSIVIP